MDRKQAVVDAAVRFITTKDGKWSDLAAAVKAYQEEEESVNGNRRKENSSSIQE